eukprot:TRINITY_DN25324_c0_g3_i1.p1 TRINITY_DN25324_c0_g3~~TRINITY_DN25324_c0_g3_i1.p1  ORF type:complete len:346 (+),score=24.45 TRINITY_DN25324_c0_g3_i1:97-1134(+)
MSEDLPIPAASTTLGLPNRERDRARVESFLRLPEFPHLDVQSRCYRIYINRGDWVTEEAGNSARQLKRSYHGGPFLASRRHGSDAHLDGDVDGAAEQLSKKSLRWGKKGAAVSSEHSERKTEDSSTRAEGKRAEETSACQKKISRWGKRHGAEHTNQGGVATSVHIDGIDVAVQLGRRLPTTLVAKGYRRVLYGDHGPYLELSESQVHWPTFLQHQRGTVVKKGPEAYYDEYHHEVLPRTCTGASATSSQPKQVPKRSNFEAAETISGSISNEQSAVVDLDAAATETVMLYAQKRTVADRPNPPRSGKWWTLNDRPEGYADYQPGFFYLAIDEDELVVEIAEKDS